MVTREELEADLKRLKADFSQTMSNANAIKGAIQFVQGKLEEMDTRQIVLADKVPALPPHLRDQ